MLLGNNIEVGYYAGVTTVAECVADKNMSGVSVGEENFNIYGSGVSGIDNIDLGSSPNTNSILVLLILRGQMGLTEVLVIGKLVQELILQVTQLTIFKTTLL